MTNFEKAMEFVATWEWRGRADGYPTDDPKDPGGYTRWGISQRANPDVDVKNLDLVGALDIYRKRYWNVMNCDSFPMPMAVALMDSAVNTGVGRTKKFLQGIDLDDPFAWAKLCEKRVAFYLSLKNPRFEKGWLGRVNDLKKYITIKQYEGR